MSKEIRRVPKDWQHPKDEDGRYRPMVDEEYETAAQEWIDGVLAWADGTHEDLIDKPELKEKYPFFWGRHGGPPDSRFYRPKFDGEPVCHQIYESVSEGTPFSPVFGTLDEMKEWLLAEGYSEYAAENFIKDGWAPSMVFIPGKGLSGTGIHSFDLFKVDDE